MATSISSSNGDSNKTRAAIASIISVCIVALACTIIFGVLARRKRSFQNMPSVAKPVPMDHIFAPGVEQKTVPQGHVVPQVDVGPEKDLDRNELENVELV
jgi:hypothetical protein